MKNLSEKQLGVENTVKELRELISYISEIISIATELASQVKELASGNEVIERIVFSMPGELGEMPGQTSEKDEEITSGNSEPKQATTITY